MTALDITATTVGIAGGLTGVLTYISATRGGLARKREQAIADAVHREIEPLTSRIVALETKMEIFWRGVGYDAARILHSPDVRRAHVDELLERYMAGTLTPRDAADLRHMLRRIRDHEPGNDVGFPIYPGEQTAAAILLRVMELSGAGRA